MDGHDGNYHTSSFQSTNELESIWIIKIINQNLNAVLLAYNFMHQLFLIF